MWSNLIVSTKKKFIFFSFKLSLNRLFLLFCLFKARTYSPSPGKSFQSLLTVSYSIFITFYDLFTSYFKFFITESLTKYTSACVLCTSHTSSVNRWYKATILSMLRHSLKRNNLECFFFCFLINFNFFFPQFSHSATSLCM